MSVPEHLDRTRIRTHLLQNQMLSGDAEVTVVDGMGHSQLYAFPHSILFIYRDTDTQTDRQTHTHTHTHYSLYTQRHTHRDRQRDTHTHTHICEIHYICKKAQVFSLTGQMDRGAQERERERERGRERERERKIQGGGDRGRGRGRH